MIKSCEIKPSTELNSWPTKAMSLYIIAKDSSLQRLAKDAALWSKRQDAQWEKGDLKEGGNCAKSSAT